MLSYYFAYMSFMLFRLKIPEASFIKVEAWNLVSSLAFTMFDVKVVI